jgi:hypothetical protein
MVRVARSFDIGINIGVGLCSHLCHTRERETLPADLFVILAPFDERFSTVTTTTTTDDNKDDDRRLDDDGNPPTTTT